MTIFRIRAWPLAAPVVLSTVGVMGDPERANPVSVPINLLIGERN
jgi:hypothetical protein